MTQDFLIFNNLSFLTDVHTVEATKKYVADFVSLLKVARSMGVRKVRTNEKFLETKASGSSLFEIAQSLPHTLRNLFMSLIDSPYINNEDSAKIIEFLNNKSIKVGGMSTSEAEGFLCAIIHNTASLSFHSAQEWDCNLVTVDTEDEIAHITQSHDVLHASTSAHLKSHSIHLGLSLLKISKLIPTSQRPLPNSEFVIKFILPVAASQFSSFLSGMTKPDQTAKIREIAAEVAHVNGYSFESELSNINHRRRNSLRQIFSHGQDNGQLFISTDFEKGAFEVCDFRGRHLGEYSFWGNLNSKRDKSGDHDVYFSIS